MSYFANWPKHLLAPITSACFSDALARDFWTSGEDLWDHKIPIKKRWLKFLWVYSMSAIAQITLPSIVAVAIVAMFKYVPIAWWVISIGSGTAFGLLLAVVFSTSAYFDVDRRAKQAVRVRKN